MSRVAQVVWSAVSRLRSRLPLYSNDEARLKVRHADALIAAMTGPRRSRAARRAAALDYARRFQMPSSVSRLADALAGSAHREEILDALERAARERGGGAAARLHHEVVRELAEEHGMTTASISPSTAAHPPVPETEHPPVVPTPDPNFGYATIADGVVTFSPNGLAGDGPLVLVTGLGLKPDALDWSALAGVDRLHVLDLAFGVTPGRLDAIRSHLPDGAEVTITAVLADEVAQYTDGDQEVSDFSDALGRAIVADVAASPYVRRRLDPGMDEVLALKISDQVYRQVQRVYAVLAAVRRIPGARVIATELALVPALAHVAPTWLWGMRPPPRGRIPVGGSVRTPTRRDTVLALREVEGILAGQLDHHLAPPRSDLPRVVLATSGRLPAYAAAGDSLREHLEGRFAVHTLDFRPPPTLKEFVAKPRNTLSLAIATSKSAQTDVLADIAVGALVRALRDVELAGVPGGVVFHVTRGSLLQIAASLFSLWVLHDRLRAGFEAAPPAAVLAVPGRLAEVRTVMEAARAAGVPVVDLQVLFVSTMARYKPPVADRFLVIDAQTRELYLDLYGLDPDVVEMVGSLQLDREMAVVRAFDAADERRGMGLPPDSTLVTYGVQTHPQEFILARALEMAEYCAAHPGTSLCLKLHPKQSEALADWLEGELRAAYPDVPLSVQLRTDFARVLAATDVLVTHFSNVGVSAAAAGVPVIAMPTPDGLTGIDLEELGAAVSAPDKAALHAALDRFRRADGPPLPYRERNPLMGDGGTLDRVEAVLQEAARGRIGRRSPPRHQGHSA